MKLVKIRNPWKEGEWKGKWADTSSEWTNELRKELGHTVASDGIFWMQFEDMTQVFEDVDIVKI